MRRLCPKPRENQGVYTETSSVDRVAALAQHHISDSSPQARTGPLGFPDVALVEAHIKRDNSQRLYIMTLHHAAPEAKICLSFLSIDS